MVKQRHIKGFTLLETLIVLLIITSSYFSFDFNKLTPVYQQYELIASMQYIQHQALYNSKTMIFDQRNVYSNDPIYFNARGNVNKSQTITLGIKQKEYQLVIYLGGGRIEIK